MNLVLKRFSQDVDLLNGGQKINFLVFDNDGEEVRFPVPEETALSIMTYMAKHLHVKDAPPVPAPSQEVEEEEEFETEATQFGGIDEEEDEEFDEAEPPQDEIPGSEDEVPPL
jgi:hypothetical protein